MSLANAPTLHVETLRADPDGCVAYLVVDPSGKEALAIDPRLDQVATLAARAEALGAKLRWVMDTHTHADHLTGAARLAAKAGAQLAASALSKLEGAAHRVKGGDTLPLGASTVKVLDAPGHTPDSLALLVDGHLFTGDALFVGGAGRTDFPGGSSQALYRTFRSFEELPDPTVVHPGHDYDHHPVSTVGAEKTANPLLAEKDPKALAARMDVRGSRPADMLPILAANLGHETWRTVEAKALADELAAGPVTLIDVREPIEFAGAHIAGSTPIPLAELESRLDRLPPARPVTLVCRSGARATHAAQTLRHRGFAARVLEGGMLAWNKAGLPTAGTGSRLAIDRQVQLVVGPAILLGLTLGLLVHPAFFAIPAFVGAGLTFAGATGLCGLAFVLARMPWNRLDEPSASPGGSCSVGGARPATASCAVGGAPASACAVGGGKPLPPPPPPPAPGTSPQGCC